MKKILFVAAIASTALFSACEKKAGESVELKNEVDTVSYALGCLNSAPSATINQHLQRNGSDSAYVKEFLIGLEDGLSAADDKKKLAYMMGTMIGMQGSQAIQQVGSQMFGSDSTKTLDLELFLQGFRDMMNETPAFKNAEGKPVTQMEIQMIMRTAMEAAEAKALEITKKASADFMAEVAKKEGVKALGNGVFYKEIKAGEGECPAAEDNVVIAYEGRLTNGKVFDKNDNFPATANRFIPGFNLALQNMKPGAEWEVYIPSDQAYGDRSMGGDIPAGSALIFKLTLKSVEKAAPAPAAEGEKKN